MPTIRFVKNRPSITVQEGANLMRALLDAHLPVASSCHGDGICGRCRIIVVEGGDNLSPINPTEEILRDRLKIPPAVRISCQTQIFGDVVVDTSYW